MTSLCLATSTSTKQQPKMRRKMLYCVKIYRELEDVYITHRTLEKEPHRDEMTQWVLGLDLNYNPPHDYIKYYQVQTHVTEPITVHYINEIVKLNKDNPSFKENDISDGYHTYSDLYEFRKQYNAALFNEWAESEGFGGLPIIRYDVHKSKRHYDGELCFGGGWFIVVAMLPSGQISNHYKMEDWDLFKVPEVDKAKYEFDGHTGQDVINRLNELNNQ